MTAKNTLTGLLGIAIGIGLGIATQRFHSNAKVATNLKRSKSVNVLNNDSDGYVLSETLVDFGNMREGQAASAVVELSCPDTNEIRIGRITTSCKCLSVNTDKMIASKNEKIKITLNFHSLTAHGDKRIDYFIEIVKPKKSIVKGHVKAMIKRVPAKIMMDKSMVRYGVIKKTTTESLKLWNLTKKDVRIKVVDPAGLNVAFSATNGVVEGGGFLRISLTADPFTFKRKPLHGKVLLSTSLPLHSIVAIPFDGNVKK